MERGGGLEWGALGKEHLNYFIFVRDCLPSRCWLLVLVLRRLHAALLHRYTWTVPQQSQSRRGNASSYENDIHYPHRQCWLQATVRALDLLVAFSLNFLTSGSSLPRFVPSIICCGNSSSLLAKPESQPPFLWKPSLHHRQLLPRTDSVFSEIYYIKTLEALPKHRAPHMPKM